MVPRPHRTNNGCVPFQIQRNARSVTHNIVRETAEMEENTISKLKLALKNL